MARDAAEVAATYEKVCREWGENPSPAEVAAFVEHYLRAFEQAGP